MEKIGIFSSIGMIIAWIVEAFGGWDEAMTTLVICMLIDYITGLNERYENWIKDYKHNLLVLDVDRIKFENRPEDFQEVIDKIDAQLYGLFKDAE